MDPTEPTPQEVTNVRRALKRLRAEPVVWRPLTGRGYTPARRWIVTLDGGRTAFVKIATDVATASWIRDEHVVYSVLRGASFMPVYLGFFDDGRAPVLALEDLTAAAWPPPWDRSRIDAVLECLAGVAAATAPEGLPRLDDEHLELRGGWAEIGQDPDPFLALGLCGRGWLEANLDALHEAAEAAPLAGDALLHLDVRSDNICFRGDGTAVLVDWNHTSVGNPVADVACWLPSLQAEGGPPPEEILAEPAPELASLIAGYFCLHAGLPVIPSAPNVRAVQMRQAATALPWAARALGLPPPA